MTAAIYYHPEAYTTSGPKLMGRNAAGESFLKGYLKHSQASEFWVQVQKPEHGQHFAQTAKALDRPQAVKVVEAANLSALHKVGTVYYPGPGIGEHAQHRAMAGAGFSNPHTAWSLCGITHTTSSAGAMDALAELITAPVQSWDAVICTSTAVKDNVQRLLQAQVNYLQERLGVSKLVLPLLPVIPLGIHTQDFVYSQDQKAKARQSLGADANTLVVLFMGRLSFHAKAHPLAMYQALQTAAQQVAQTGQKIMLVECGWHANDFIQKAYQDAAQLACPSVQVRTLDGRLAEHRQTAWAGADVFCSLSDNIQETFGIVPIEAMAAGLPVVVSDWDGYKDTVRHGTDGFRIATCMPDAGLGGDLALRHALQVDTYDMYCGHTCSMVSVDIEATAQAFVQLAQSAELRQRMGQAGKERAQSVYDWSVIIAQYEDLWQQQTQLRLAAQSKAPQAQLAQAWPARLDPFQAFAAYPSSVLKPTTQLALVDASADLAMARVNQYKGLAMVNFAKWVLPSDSEIAAVLQLAESGPCTAQALVQGVAADRQAFVFRALVWLMKLGVLRQA
ncbi:MAG: glycosyltransferase [Betaproteobacteria bacterium]|nr:glycosyltransferase [Betaproteobacteria bacterium]